MRVDSDPQSNPIKLLAYDISRKVEERSIAFRDIEALVKIVSDKGAIDRAGRLRERSGLSRLSKNTKALNAIAASRTDEGFETFKSWAENPLQGLVLTAHPTFSLSRDIRETLGEIAKEKSHKNNKLEDELKKFPYLPKRAPTLQEEHEDAQKALVNIQGAVEKIHRQILEVAAAKFPKRWTEITPNLIHVYSWVGYDIDGRTDISWGDALRLRLQEKRDQIKRYLSASTNLLDNHQPGRKSEKHIEGLIDLLSDGLESADRDLSLFNKDLSNTSNLVAAANNLTRASKRRLLNLNGAIALIDDAIKNSDDTESQASLVILRSAMHGFGLGTSRIHFRLNSRHVISGVKSVFGIQDDTTDTRTLLLRASELTKKVKTQTVNFASLALEKSTAHQQMIMTAQILKYVDNETPIRLLIAESEDSLTPLGMLYIARLYGLENHLDISPLFETADALNNGGRIISKMLANPVYREYIEKRGVFAIQTGFSDAGRFMGQIPATLAIERLQSHFAAAMAEHNVKNVTAIVFNTHGESMGRGGHPGTIQDRVDYVMSPWAIAQFENRNLPLCHETSFQGGDGYMWFQNADLAAATVTSLLLARHADRSEVNEDIFYLERDFSWDMFTTLSSEQASLYADPNYVNLLGGFGQNLLVPTGSRAAKRAKSDHKTGMFNPRQLRAIPHNAILQQFGAQANIFFGVGRSASVDPEKFAHHLETSARAKSIFELVAQSLQRTNLSILSAYGRVFDPGFWVSRALSGNEPFLANKCLAVSRTMATQDWRARIMDLANRLRMDMFDAQRHLQPCGSSKLVCPGDESLKILHALRLAVLMKMMIIACDLPAHGDERSTQLNVLQRLQNFEIDSILADLKDRYPAVSQDLNWTQELSEKSTTDSSRTGGFPHLVQTVIKPLDRASQLVRQISIAITHHYDAFG